MSNRSEVRPHILMVSGNAPPVIDGVADFTARLIAEMKAQRPNWRFSWLTRRPRWWHAPVVRRNGVRLVRFNHTWVERDRKLACSVAAKLRPNLVHIQEQIHSFHETDAEPRIAQAAGCPIVTTLHEYHVELPSVVHTNALVVRSDAVVSNDTRTAERCQEQTGRIVDDRLWTGNPVPPRPRRPEPGAIATFGFLSTIKTLDLPFQAIKTLRSSGRDLKWRLVGPYAPKINREHARLSVMGEQAWVEFTGSLFEPALGEMLSRSRIMVLPFADGASLRRSTLQAAWSLGIPVITTPPTSDEPAIVDEENCLLVREPTPAAWAAAIERILDDAALEAKLAQGSLDTAARFSWPELARRYLAIYDRLLPPTTKGAND